MVKLTEEMVAARAKTSDMEMVTKLNFWGSDLTDVSLVSKFKRAVILSFSLNNISTLADFQYCTALVELYIRRNNIRDLREICYLKDLVNLKRLLMTENPCCESAGDLYRPTVLRALNRLEVLDNQEVTPIELEYALQLGLILEHPADRKQKIITPGNKYYEGPDDNIQPWNPSSHITTTKQQQQQQQLQQRGGTGYDENFMENDKKDHYHYTLTSVTPNTINNTFSRTAESGMDVSSFSMKPTERPQRPSTAMGALHGQHPHCPPVHEMPERIPPESAYRQPTPTQRKCASPLLEFYRNDFCRQKNSAQTVESARTTISTTKWSHINNVNNNNYDWASTTSNNSITDPSNTSVTQQHHHHHQNNNNNNNNNNHNNISLGPAITLKKNNSNLVSAALCLISELNSHDLDILENAIRRKQEEFSYAQRTQNKSDQRSSYRLNLN